MEERQNVIQEKSYRFALGILKLSESLREQKDFVLQKQILRSGTSIGANVEEALGGQTKKDFHMKISIAYKEARETKYWLRLLQDSGKISKEIITPYLQEIEDIIKILAKIKITIQKNITK